MKASSFFKILTTPFFVLALSQCAVIEPDAGGSGGIATQLDGNAPSFSQPLTAETGAGSVIIREGGRVLSSFRTASPYVEETRWIDGQNRVVVKSRGKHGPATVQLFESRSGREVARVFAYDIRGGQPAWATGMGE